MSYAVDSAWRISCWITPISWNRLGPESKELAAAGPMKGSRTRRVCTLRMLFLIERSALQVLTTRRGLFIVSRSKSQPLFFQHPNRRLQPLFHRFFNFCLIAVAIERVQRFSGIVQWNMAAGNLLRARLGRHQVHQNAGTARTRILFRIKIHASKGILENVLRPPRSLRRAAIAAVFQKLEFKS